MNILHINTNDSGGGAETVVIQLLRHQQNSSLVVKTSVATELKGIELPKSRKDRFFHFIDQVLWKIGIHKKFKRIFFLEDELNDTYTKLAALTIYQQADIIHLHNLHGGYFDLTALRKIAEEKKIVWTLHDMWCMTGGEAYTYDNNNYKKGIAYTPFKDQYPLRNSVIDRRQHFMELKKKIYKDIAPSTVFVPVSKWLESCFQSSYTFNKLLKTRVIYNGIRTNIFYKKQERNWETPRILIFNQNSPIKGHDLYASILPLLPKNIELTIIGKTLPFTPDQPHKYLPYITDRTELANCYNQHDILLFPSKAEAFDLIPLEAMACGVCVFASKIGGIPEIIINEQNGYLFENAEDLFSLISNKLDNIEQLRIIGSRAAEYVQNNFSINRMFQNYEILYNEILKDS